MGNRRTSIFENGLIWFGAGGVLGRNFNRYIFRILRIFYRIISNHHWTYHWMWYDVFAGFIGGKTRKKCNGNGKMSFGSTGALLFCSVKYPAVSWMDSDHDL